MTTDDIIEMWNNESLINETTLGKQAREIPQLHAKYLNLWRNTKYDRDKTQSKYKFIIYAKKDFLTNPTKSEFNDKGWEYPDKSFMKSQIPEMAEMDPMALKLNERLIELNTRLDVLTEILKQINNRNWYIQAAIKDRDYLMGRN